MDHEAARCRGHWDMPICPGESCQQQRESAQHSHNIEKTLIDNPICNHDFSLCAPKMIAMECPVEFAPAYHFHK